jgi:hypothetical protein
LHPIHHSSHPMQGAHLAGTGAFAAIGGVVLLTL